MHAYKKEESSMYNFRIVAKGWRIRAPRINPARSGRARPKTTNIVPLLTESVNFVHNALTHYMGACYDKNTIYKYEYRYAH